MHLLPLGGVPRQEGEALGLSWVVLGEMSPWSETPHIIWQNETRK